ncbi:MAG: hypothetical protein WCS73_02075 [Lentisphaeria bacterium]
MAHELVYTSAARGLRPGSQGYCTVAYTQGMPPASIQIMEAISSYKSLYSAMEEQDNESPTSYSHYKSKLLGRDVSILSRISPTQADHTGRSNKLAHHLLIHKRERLECGPVWLSLQTNLFYTEWEGKPHILKMPKVLTDVPIKDMHASYWEEVTGDAGYAGLLAESFVQDISRPYFIVYAQDMDILRLLAEASSLVPIPQRWQLTFNTYFTTLPAGMTCAWRCCLPETPILRDTRHQVRGDLLDLTKLDHLPGLDSKNFFIQLARSVNANKESLEVLNSVPESEKAPKKKFVLIPKREINMLNLKPRKLE